jgi:hypothetical protein
MKYPTSRRPKHTHQYMTNTNDITNTATRKATFDEPATRGRTPPRSGERNRDASGNCERYDIILNLSTQHPSANGSPRLLAKGGGLVLPLSDHKRQQVNLNGGP